MLRARAGDAAAQDTLRETLRPRLESLAGYYASRTGMDAADLLQEAWVAVFEALPTVDVTIGSSSQFLLKHARWQILDHIRWNKRRSHDKLDDMLFETREIAENNFGVGSAGPGPVRCRDIDVRRGSRAPSEPASAGHPARAARRPHLAPDRRLARLHVRQRRVPCPRHPAGVHRSGGGWPKGIGFDNLRIQSPAFGDEFVARGFKTGAFSTRGEGAARCRRWISTDSSFSERRSRSGRSFSRMGGRTTPSAAESGFSMASRIERIHFRHRLRRIYGGARTGVEGPAHLRDLQPLLRSALPYSRTISAGNRSVISRPAG